MKILIAFLALLLPIAAGAQSCTTAVCNASSTSEAAVLAAMPSSGNANATVVVNIPSGTSAWATDFVYTIPTAVTNLTIQGATTVTWTGTAGTATWNYTAADNTVIQDADPGNNSLIFVTTGSPTTKFRMTGMTYEETTGGNKFSGGEVGVGGNSSNFRFDHNHITGTGHQNVWLQPIDAVIGVIDHNAGDENGTVATNADNYFRAFDPVDDNIGFGDGPWSHASLWGTVNFLFIESNYIKGGAPNDCAEGGRFVMRYNTLDSNYVAIQTHATKSDAGAGRGCRAFEAYHNYITGPTGAATGDAPIGTKGGPGLVWGNLMPQGFYRFFVPSTDRNINPANVNESAGQPTDWGYCGTNINKTGSTWDGNQNAALGYPCLDGVARGQGDALNGANTIAARRNTVTGTQSYPHELLEPVYLFMNTVNPASGIEVNARDQTTTQDRDYYQECNSGWSDSTCASTAFNGAHGTGFGLLSARPTACTAGPGGTFGASPTGSYGVGYWATDANSGQGELYVCTATGSPGTWTAIYQPYVYPHPLVNSLTGTSMALASSNNNPVAGTNITLTATITPSSGPTGTVTFFDGGVSVGTGAVSSGVATLTVTAITAGTHTYTATYGGDGTYAGSSSSAVTVTALITTSTALASSNNTPSAGTNITLTATITPSSGPTGTVAFFDGGTGIGTGAVSSGVATHTVTAITAGVHTYTATYSGSGTYATSTSSPVTVTASVTAAGASHLSGVVAPSGVVIK